MKGCRTYPRTLRSVRVCSIWFRLMMFSFRSTFMAKIMSVSFSRTRKTFPKLPLPMTRTTLKESKAYRLGGSRAPAGMGGAGVSATVMGPCGTAFGRGGGCGRVGDWYELRKDDVDKEKSFRLSGISSASARSSKSLSSSSSMKPFFCVKLWATPGSEVCQPPAMAPAAAGTAPAVPPAPPGLATPMTAALGPAGAEASTALPPGVAASPAPPVCMYCAPGGVKSPDSRSSRCRSNISSISISSSKPPPPLDQWMSRPGGGRFASVVRKLRMT
mmetsp:Transcript_23876/g.69967  ORF Transcript_23876/g.69967 Transcript_23876/m.69967 type:complete len:273 (+) Transcript_23876:922-1740(+)